MDDLETLAQKQQIVEVITDLFVATDRRDWPTVLECLAPEVNFDMASLGGPPAADTPAKEIVAAWDKGLAPLEAVHHQVGNFRVWPRGEAAEAFCYGIAVHYRSNPTGRNTRTFVGSYEIGLIRDGERWRIRAFRFDAKYVDGNVELEKG
jgi:SnoaL-like domain